MSGTEQKRIGTRDDYRWFTAITTRWMDNDVYGHVNNVTYYSFFDTAVNGYLLDFLGDLAPERAPALLPPAAPVSAEG